MTKQLHTDECFRQWQAAPNAKAMAAVKCICGGGGATLDEDPEPIPGWENGFDGGFGDWPD